MDQAEMELVRAASDEDVVFLWHEDTDDDLEIVASYFEYLGDNGIMVLQ